MYVTIVEHFLELPRKLTKGHQPSVDGTCILRSAKNKKQRPELGLNRETFRNVPDRFTTKGYSHPLPIMYFELPVCGKRKVVPPCLQEFGVLELGKALACENYHALPVNIKKLDVDMHANKLTVRGLTHEVVVGPPNSFARSALSPLLRETWSRTLM